MRMVLMCFLHFEFRILHYKIGSHGYR